MSDTQVIKDLLDSWDCEEPYSFQLIMEQPEVVEYLGSPEALEQDEILSEIPLSSMKRWAEGTSYPTVLLQKLIIRVLETKFK